MNKHLKMILHDVHAIFQVFLSNKTALCDKQTTNLGCKSGDKITESFEFKNQTNLWMIHGLVLWTGSTELLIKSDSKEGFGHKLYKQTTIQKSLSVLFYYYYFILI